MIAGRAVGLLVAAGSGERLGAKAPKAFVEVGGAPLLLHAARALAACDDLEALVVVAGDVQRAGDLLARAGVATRAIVAGGAERNDSVARGLEALDRADAVVAVHDAARPLVTPELVTRTVRALTQDWAGVAPALPVVDTLKLAQEDGRVLRTVDRRGLWAVQTPQVFPRRTLAQAHARTDPAGVTDDLGLVERAGGRVRLIPGDRLNLKVTYRDDLELVAALLAARGRP